VVVDEDEEAAEEDAASTNGEMDEDAARDAVEEAE
jgi:hypothetical protein